MSSAMLGICSLTQMSPMPSVAAAKLESGTLMQAEYLLRGECVPDLIWRHKTVTVSVTGAG